MRGIKGRLSKIYIGMVMSEEGLWKRRTKGRIMLDIKKKQEQKGESADESEEINEIMEGRMNLNGEMWRIIGVYVWKDEDLKIRKIKEKIDGGKRGKVLVRGDFNVRTSEKREWWKVKK